MNSSEKSGALDAFQRGEQVLHEFSTAVEAISHDESMSARLALAETTVRISLAGENGHGATLLLDRTPIEVVSEGEGEVELTVSSSDLERLWSDDDFSLAVAIGEGRAQARGPVRQFLRVLPILRQGLQGVRAEAEAGFSALHGDVSEDAGDEDWGPDARELLDQAAEFEHHEGALEVAEEYPGAYWSIEFVDAHKAFGPHRVLNGLNLGIPEGMITVILGPSGAGKTVLIKHIIGLLFPDSGDVLVHGQSVPSRTRSELFEMRRQFGMLFQDGALFGSMNLYDNVAFPLREHTNKREREIREIVMQRLEEVGLAGALDRMPNELSGGMRKRAGFARALVLEPQIVMFDEPDSGLDPVRTALLSEVVRRVHSEHGGTYIVVTHDIESARRLGDYIALLWKGRIVQGGERQEMFNSKNPFVRQFLSRDTEGPLGMQ